MTSTPSRRRRFAPLRSRGVSLIEVLVVMVIAAVVLLGLASLSLSAIQYNKPAYLRSISAELAYDLSDRMRSNLSGVVTGAYALPAFTGDYASYVSAESGFSPPACYDVDTGSMTTCANATEVAAADLYMWKTNARALLPEVAAQITALTFSNGYQVVVGYRERGATVGSGTNCPATFTADNSIRCFVVDVTP